MNRIGIWLCFMVAIIFLFPSHSHATSTSVSVKLKQTIGNTTTLPLTLNGNYFIKDTGTTLTAGSGYSVVKEGTLTSLYLNGEQIHSNTHFTLTPETYDEDHTIRMASYNYLGDIFYSIENNVIRPVNTLPLEDYLKGVVPYEMSNSWPLESLKAQAVAARTYALGKGSLTIDDTTNNQVYYGFNPSLKRSNQAVLETQGEVMRSGNHYVQAFYMSTNGGVTLTNKNTWGSTKLPYFDLKNDPYSIAADKYLNWKIDLAKTTLDISSLNMSTPDAWWTSTVEQFNIPTINELKSVLSNPSNKYGLSGSEIKILGFHSINLMTNPSDPNATLNGNVSFDFIEKKNGEYVMEDGAIKVQTLTLNERIDTLRAYLNRSVLKSPLIHSVIETEDAYTIIGSGFGHGIGMSQWGAYNMAGSGFNYTDILNFYYPNHTLVDEIAPIISGLTINSETNDRLQLSFFLDEPSIVNITIDGNAIFNESLDNGNVFRDFDLPPMLNGVHEVIITTKDSSNNQSIWRESFFTILNTLEFTSITDRSVDVTFDNRAQIQYTIDRPASVQVRILDKAGRLVKVIQPFNQINAGTHVITSEVLNTKSEDYQYDIIANSSIMKRTSGSFSTNTLPWISFSHPKAVASDNKLTLTYSVNQSGHTTIRLLDDVGRLIGTLKEPFDHMEGTQSITVNLPNLKNGDYKAQIISTNQYGISTNTRPSFTVKNTEQDLNPVSTYTVKSGDTLWGISVKTKTSVSDLMSINKLPNSSIYIGQTLSLGTSNNKPPEQTDTQLQKHVVSSGETLWRISIKYNVSVSSIVSKNQLSSTILSVGQTLIIPN